jgi:hypothetical protein
MNRLIDGFMKVLCKVDHVEDFAAKVEDGLVKG